MNLESFNSLFRNKDKPEPDVSQLNNKRLFRTDLLSGKDKRKLDKLICNNKITDYHHSYSLIAETIGRKEYSRIRLESIAKDKAELAENGEKRKKELLALGKEKELFLLDAPVNIFSIHSEDGVSIEDINDGLSEDIGRNLIEIGYRENTDYKQIDCSGAGKILRFEDSSGKIDKRLINKLISDQDKTSFIMFGGNLRGCFLSALDNVLFNSNVEKELKKLDIHIPLDKCYDNDSYKKITGYDDINSAIQDRMLKKNAEFYEDGQLTWVTGNPEDLESKYRFYLWSNSKIMESEMNNQVELEKIRKEFD